MCSDGEVELLAYFHALKHDAGVLDGESVIAHCYHSCLFEGGEVAGLFAFHSFGEGTDGCDEDTT